MVSYENAQTNAFVAVTGFQGHTAPLDLTISIGNAEIASEHLERLELTPQVAVNYTDTAGLTRVTEEPAHIGTGLIRISKSIEPEFPAVATASHMSGVVYVDTVISGEGTVREAQPIWSTSPIFEKPAVDDVRLQSYQPFIIGGKPVEAETIVVVSFSVRPPPAY